MDTRQVLTEIVNRLELMSAAIGGLEKALSPSVVKADALDLARKAAAIDVKDHFDKLRQEIASLGT